jgi:hypothetical protein
MCVRMVILRFRAVWLIGRYFSIIMIIYDTRYGCEYDGESTFDYNVNTTRQIAGFKLRGVYKA